MPPRLLTVNCGNHRDDENDEGEQNPQSHRDDEGQTHEPPRPVDDTHELENEEDDEEGRTDATATAETYFLVAIHFFYFLSFFLYLV